MKRHPVLVWLGLYLLVEASLGFLFHAGFLPLETRFQRELFASDKTLGHRLVANAKTNFDRRRRRHHVEVVTNRYGFRDAAMDQAPHPGVLRIAAMGDSVTFGWEVPEPETYPRQLETLLRNRGLAVEVFNFGIPGHHSAAGRLMLDEVLKFSPDVLLLGYGFNDWKFRDQPWQKAPGLATQNSQASTNLLVRSVGLIRNSYLLSWIEEKGRKKNLSKNAPADFSAYHHSISRAEYLENLRDMIVRAKAKNIRVVLLNVSFSNDYTADLLQRLSREQQVPFLDLRTNFEVREGERLEHFTERTLKLSPTTYSKGAGHLSNTVTIDFRVFVPPSDRARVTEKGLYLYGPQSILGEGRHGFQLLHDDGRAGDERAKDFVYSVRLTLARSDLQKLEEDSLQFTFLACPPTEDRLQGEPVPLVTNFLYHGRLAKSALLNAESVIAPLTILGFAPTNRLLLAGTDFVHPNGLGFSEMAEVIAKAIGPHQPLKSAHKR